MIETRNNLYIRLKYSVLLEILFYYRLQLNYCSSYLTSSVALVPTIAPLKIHNQVRNVNHVIPLPLIHLYSIFCQVL